MKVCGDGGDPGSAILLLGMGLGTFSMSASAVLRIKWVIRSFSSQRATRVLYLAMRMESAESVRTLLDDELRTCRIARTSAGARRGPGPPMPIEIVVQDREELLYLLCEAAGVRAHRHVLASSTRCGR